MKYYLLGSLRSLIDKGKSNKNRYLIAIDIIDGLTEIHKLNYVHYDLKVSNILCEEFNCKGEIYIKAVISDFSGVKNKKLF